MKLGLVFIIVISAIVSSLNNEFWETIRYRNKISHAATTASWILKLVEGYQIKMITEESEDGGHFGNLAQKNNATWSLSGSDIVNYLKANGTSSDPNDEACKDSSGAIIGLSEKAYVSCSLPDYIPYSGTQNYSVVFTRTAPQHPQAHYVTGYSAIKAVFTFGSAPGEPFSLETVTANDKDQKNYRPYNPEFAHEILHSLNMRNVSSPKQLLMASPLSFQITKDGTLQATIDLTRNSEIAIRSDGATPYAGDQSMGNHSLTDVKSLVWGPNSSQLSEDGNIVLGGGPGVSKIQFDKSQPSKDVVQESSTGLQVISNLVDFSKDVTIHGDLTVNGTVGLANSGASLSRTPQSIVSVTNGGNVPYPVCAHSDAARAIPFASADIPTQSGANPIVGFYPELIANDKKKQWQAQFFNITQEGTRIPVSSNTRVGVITYCDE